jgi:hypothetical protein
MRSRIITSAPFYGAAVLVGMYVSSGMPARYAVVDVSVSVFATYMSRRRRSPRLTLVDNDPTYATAMGTAVEESLVRAS